MLATFSYARFRTKKHRGEDVEKQNSASRCSITAAAELGRQPAGSRLLRVRRTLSVAPGNSAFVLVNARKNLSTATAAARVAI